MWLPATRWKGKSGRRPLQDFSNDVSYRIGRSPSKSVHGKHKFPAISMADDEQQSVRVDVTRVEEEGGSVATATDGSPDPLFLLHSDLSSLLRQIDELVLKAANLKTRSRHGTREIESFRSVLSDMLSSLKPWVPRLHKAISDTPLQAENLEELSLMTTTSLCVGEEYLFEVESPEHTKFESLISHSPLVSWRTDLDIDKGRQLFLLTPMTIGRSKSSEHQGLSKPAFERITSNVAGTQPPDGLIGGKVMKVAADSNSTGPVVAVTRSKVEHASAFSPVFGKKAQSELLMTPCLKMSPPKSCALLEPASGSRCQGKWGASKSTGFPSGISNIGGSQIYASSCGGNSGSLALKYPELLGIENAPGNIKTDLEASPDWSFSPPKTCVLLEPPDEHLGETKNVKDSEHDRGSLRMVESNPMWKEAKSITEKSRKPGESTLKRELWTRFEAASAHGLSYSSSAFQGTSRKGFLEMLEEVSGDEGELR